MRGRPQRWQCGLLSHGGAAGGGLSESRRAPTLAAISRASVKDVLCAACFSFGSLPVAGALMVGSCSSLLDDGHVEG